MSDLHSFQGKMTKAAFEQKLIAEVGGVDKIYASPYNEDGIPLTLYYRKSDDKHVATWQRAGCCIFKWANQRGFTVVELMVAVVCVVAMGMIAVSAFGYLVHKGW